MRFTVVALLAFSGCLRQPATPEIVSASDHSHYQALSKHVEVPDEPAGMISYAAPPTEMVRVTPPPLSLATEETEEYLDLSLEETLRLAFENAQILRDLGGTVLRVPDGARTRNDPSIVETDPRFGIEGALSAYDATFTSNFSFENNDRALNNVFFGGGVRELKQDFSTWQSQIAKTSGTGTQFALKNYIQYDSNNAPGNAFYSAFTTWNDIEARIHCCRERCTVQSTGRAQCPARVINGVVIARINSDMALADFEMESAISRAMSRTPTGICISPIAIWMPRSRPAMLRWRPGAEFMHCMRKGGAAVRRRKRPRLANSITVLKKKLRTLCMESWSTNPHQQRQHGRHLSSTGGVYVIERRLRLITGLPISDGRLLRPAQEPVEAAWCSTGNRVWPRACRGASKSGGRNGRSRSVKPNWKRTATSSSPISIWWGVIASEASATTSIPTTTTPTLQRHVQWRLSGVAGWGRVHDADRLSAGLRRGPALRTATGPRTPAAP